MHCRSFEGGICPLTTTNLSGAPWCAEDSQAHAARLRLLPAKPFQGHYDAIACAFARIERERSGQIGNGFGFAAHGFQDVTANAVCVCATLPAGGQDLVHIGQTLGEPAQLVVRPGARRV